MTDADDTQGRKAAAAHDWTALRGVIEAGGAQRYHQANEAKGKLFARERIARLVDAGSCGAGTLEKIIRIIGRPYDTVVPMI